ncbi:hypothetical protein [Desulfosporosinus sp. BG]|nr:hypothetical protein [Desulfosporosinus sp. BG]ODA43137.1 hypothetical protein DSBG_0133 [Desulfosporosinus sp. BG]
MPDFGNSFSGLAKDRKLTDQELVRAIRYMPNCLKISKKQVAK